MREQHNYHYAVHTVGLVERLQKFTLDGPKKDFAGTPTFLSLSMHSGRIPAAYDDLEAMV